MADKFIPFNPETAKNGDVVYYLGEHNKEYRFIGNDVVRPNCVVVYAPDMGYGWENISRLTVKAPKKTVWVNVYKDKSAAWYSAEHVAFQYCLKDKNYIGTYPLEIDDVA